MQQILRPIQKSVYEKIKNNPQHFLYQRVTHTFVNNTDFYYINKEKVEGKMLVYPLQSFSPRVMNDLYERPE